MSSSVLRPLQQTRKNTPKETPQIVMELWKILVENKLQNLIIYIFMQKTDLFNFRVDPWLKHGHVLDGCVTTSHSLEYMQS